MPAGRDGPCPAALPTSVDVAGMGGPGIAAFVLFPFSETTWEEK